MQKLIMILLGFFVCGCVVDENATPSPVRQRFEPIDSEVSGHMNASAFTAMLAGSINM